MALKAEFPSIVTLVLTGHGTVERTVDLMRLGAFDCTLREATRSFAAYGKHQISERHRHRYELNNAYRAHLAEAGLVMAGINEKLDLVEIVEVEDHPWFVGVQFHPEFTSTPRDGHPLFKSYIEAAIAHSEARRARIAA